MNFNIGDFEPFPVSHPSRPETPPLDFDISHPFIGVELTVSGLPRDSLIAAQNHLQHILQDLGRQYTSFPSLDIISPATTDPLDYVWVSLADPFKEVPRPDVLDKVRDILDGIDGLCAQWKVSASRMDKTRQVYFQAEEGANLAILKTKFDRILMNRRLQVQTRMAAEFSISCSPLMPLANSRHLKSTDAFTIPAAPASFNPRWG